MDIIHDVNTKTLPRHMQPALTQRLRVMPAVVVTGARQTGKSTLVQVLTSGERRFLSLDDLDVVELARRDPEALVGGSMPVTLDEVQREVVVVRPEDIKRYGDCPALIIKPALKEGKLLYAA